MNSATIRPLIAQGVIGLSVCLGGYASVVMPLREKLGAAQAALAQAEVQAQEAHAVESSMASVMERLSQAQAQAEAITEAGGLARSQEALYASLSACAADFGLRIDEFTPVDAQGGGPVADRAAGASGDVVLRCRFGATGSYGELARLLRAISEEHGFSAVRSVRLWPESGSTGREVHAEVETEHYAVDPTPRIAPGAGEGHP